MLVCEQFVYALFNGGYQYVGTPNADKLLTEENMHQLLIELQHTKKPTLEKWFPSENVLTISKIVSVTDELKRKGVWTHTFIIRILDYLAYTHPLSLFESHFGDPSDKPPRNLQPLEMPKCTSP